jgi:hypothetical protein
MYAVPDAATSTESYPFARNDEYFSGGEEGDAEDEQYIDAVREYVVALHDFSSNNATCLSFVSGQVIRVFNRDESGWWDGELNGERGWFPSNYVDEGGLMTTCEGIDVRDAYAVNDTLYAGNNSSDIEDGYESQEAGALLAYNAKSGSDSGSVSNADQSHGSSWIHQTSAPFSSSQHTAKQPIQSRQVALSHSMQHPSRSPTPTAHNRPMNANNADQRRPSSVPAVLEPIYHAISLLHNAVRADRTAHFQPSTACIISSVRSVLSATDCLTRESQVLRANPVLAKERKQILAELSKLVTQARKASAVTLEDEGTHRGDMEHMLRLADQVAINVRKFLDVAAACHVPIPGKRSSLYDDICDARAVIDGNGAETNRLHSRREVDKTPTPDSPRSSTYRTAYTSDPNNLSPRTSRSYVDLRKSFLGGSVGTAGLASGDASPMTQAARIKAQALAGTQSDEEPRRVSTDAQRSDQSSPSSSEQYYHGSDGTRRGSDVQTKNATARPVVCTTGEIMERMQLANDHLLSIIAAFIGHIHSHTRDSHASSYAFLIDMTRATVDGVRALLIIVEAVHGCENLQADLPKQMQILWETRESVYEATSALVTAARVITSSTSSSSGGETLEGEDEKSALLQAATAVLRTGGECVGAVKLCLNRAPSGLEITVMIPPSLYASSGAWNSNERNESEEQDEEAGERHLQDAGAQSRRGKHTLSYLGRKATSLSCLRERYDQDDGSGGVNRVKARFDDIPESTAEDAEASGNATATSTILPGDSNANGAESSDSSEPMSRDHSRASASTLHSAHSNTTPNTSARPSMDREDVRNGILQDISVQPQSAPILGSFPRHGSISGGEKGSTAPPHIRDRSVSLPRCELEQNENQPPATPSSTGFPSPPRKLGRSMSSDARILGPDYDPSEVSFNSEGQLTGATLSALVEKMTPHNSTIDPTLSKSFFLCFRLFTTPIELLDVLITRFEMLPSDEIAMNADDFTRWTESKVAPVRIRVFNFLKLWLEVHWHATTDYVILDRLIKFTQTSMAHTLNKPGVRLAELAQKRMASGPNAKATTVAVNVASPSRGPGTLKRIVSSERVKTTPGFTEIVSLYTPGAMSRTGVSAPQPIVSKSLMAQLKSQSTAKVNVMDFDHLELARQLTILESRVYCSICPEELLGQEFSKKAGISGSVNIKQMSSLSTNLTGWVSECILSEEDARKRTQLMKFFIKLGAKCLSLNNYNTLFAIQGALNSSTIARLKRTWDGLPTKYRQMMDVQQRAVEHTRNFAGYRQQLRNTVAPALPFVGLFLTDLTFCHEGNAATRPSPSMPSMKLINFDKYVKMSRIIGDLQRFQQPYALLEVAEIQKFLQELLCSSHGNNSLTAEELYRRSLRLEPRNASAATNGEGHVSGSSISHMGSISGRHGLKDVGMDIFNWK